MTNSFDRVDQLSPTKRALLELKAMQSKLQAMEREKNEPIAVVGMGCRFPGGVKNPQDFWQLLRSGQDAVVEVPGDRWDINAYYDQNPDTPEKMSTRWGGFVHNIDQFDAAFFGIAPREALHMDPQQRLLLEVAWEALESAGQNVERLAGSQTGVFVGVHTSEYAWRQFDDASHINTYSGTGVSYSILAGRLSYFFDFHGPSVAIDTACSSSLMALHLACQSLRSRECELAVTGGVNLMISPLGFIAASKMHMMASDGRCKTFDAQADGYVRGEGCGVLILKRLSDAQAHGDPILALIRGSAVNQDGQRNGLTAPNVLAQEMVLRRALQQAGVRPEEVNYIETHGTGTSLGDPIEIEALTSVYGQQRADDTCLLGAVKTNIGHLEAAAGIAGMIKTILILQHKEIPPNLHFHTLNPNIVLDNTPFVLPREVHSWPGKAQSRYAGVSSFGWSGTNAHVILEAASELSALPAPVELQSPQPFLLPLSAHEPAALQDLARAYQAYLSQETSSLADICSTASLQRKQHAHRLGVVGNSRAEFQERLAAFLTALPHPDLSSGHVQSGLRPSLVFVFPGQGSQWLGMGRDLLKQEAAFREAMQQCEQAMQPFISWSLAQTLETASPATFALIDVIQPLLFAFEVSLAALWRSWGFEPDAVIGHSMGEVAAAHVAGALTLEDAARIICLRSQLLRRISGQGAMMLVELSLEQAQKYIMTRADHIAVAISNSPRSTVLAGDPAALETIKQQLEQQAIFARWIKVDVASHSPQVDSLCPELLDGLAELHPQSSRVPIYSTVFARLIDGTSLDASYWVANLRQPVHFAATVQQRLKDQRTLFLELSPHPILTASIEENIRDTGQNSIAFPSLRHNEEERRGLWRALSTLYTQGYPIDWSKHYPSNGAGTNLPSYPWQHQHFWLDNTQKPEQKDKNEFATRQNPGGGHPLLGQHLRSAAQPEVHLWQQVLRLEDVLYLQDHQVQGLIILPGAAYIEMTLAVANKIWPDKAYEIAEIAFHEMLVLSPTTSQVLQFVLTKSATDSQTIQIFSRAGDEESESLADAQWILHATGSMRLVEQKCATVPAILPVEFQRSAKQTLSGEAFQQMLHTQGLEYGPAFQGIEQIWIADKQAIARLSLAETLVKDMHNYQMHPALLDICFQVFGATVPHEETPSLYLPISIQKCILHQRYDTVMTLWSYAQFTTPETGQEQDKEFFSGNLALLNEQGDLLVEVLDFRVRRLSAQTLRSLQRRTLSYDQWLYVPTWQPVPHLSALVPPVQEAQWQPGTWLIFADATGVAEYLAHALQGLGQRCIFIWPGDQYQQLSAESYQIVPAQPEDMQRLLHEVYQHGKPPCRGILHLWSLQNSVAGIPTVDQLLQGQHVGAESILVLIQAIAQQGWRDQLRLWLFTRLAQTLPDEPVRIIAAPQWGLLRTIMHEYPALHASGVDVPEHLSPALLETLVTLCTSQTTEDQFLLREGASFIARMLPYSLLPVHSFEPEASTPSVRSDGTYLLAGGLGGLGLTLASWLVEQGAGNLVLLGRSAPSEQAAAELERLRQSGTSLHVMQADITDDEQLTRALSSIRASLPPIRGIFHTAGVLEDATLLNLDEPRWQRVLRPKMLGAWLLHILTMQDQLDYFVLFSSVASLLGSPGQGNYAAANAFVDALAHLRHVQGQPALSINWGPWAEVGLAAAQENRGHRLATRGIGNISPEQGIAVLDRLLHTVQLPPQIGVLPLNLRQWRQSHLTMAQMPFLLELLRNASDEYSQSGQQTSLILLQIQSTESPQERRMILETHLQQLLAGVLHLSSQQIAASTPLKTLGLDSLMALEFRNALEESLKLRLSATIAWSYPTIHDITEYLAGMLQVQLDTPALIKDAQENYSIANFIDIEALSDEEIESSLIEQLERGGY